MMRRQRKWIRCIRRQPVNRGRKRGGSRKTPPWGQIGGSWRNCIEIGPLTIFALYSSVTNDRVERQTADVCMSRIEEKLESIHIFDH